ncbi:MAG: SAM-dependent methyltransferase [Opitutaceae bacterium]
MHLHTCQPGYEAALVDEFDGLGIRVASNGPGWVLTEGDSLPAELVFRHRTLVDAVEIAGGSVNALAGGLADWFLESCRNERFEGPWPLVMDAAGDEKGLRRRATSVGRQLLSLIRRKTSRVARLAIEGSGTAGGRGLHAFFIDFDRIRAAREVIAGGQRRMADDPDAPSRSYLKVEEAYGILGESPQTEQVVVDLGAAPGGWSFSAAQRGARVIAVDNGPLKAGAADHPRITHRREDAFGFEVNGDPVDWLFCDLVEDPYHVLEDILERWVKQRWCRAFVVNLKCGRTDVSHLLARLKAPTGILAEGCETLRVRHLFHDRDEITLVGRVKDGGKKEEHEERKKVGS